MADRFSDERLIEMYSDIKVIRKQVEQTNLTLTDHVKKDEGWMADHVKKDEAWAQSHMEGDAESSHATVSKRLNAHARSLNLIKGGVAVIATAWASIKGFFFFNDR